MPRRTLPNDVDERQLDCLALLHDIRHLHYLIYMANRRGKPEDRKEIGELSARVLFKVNEAETLLKEMRKLAGT
jgi:hypothetical protein